MNDGTLKLAAPPPARRVPFSSSYRDGRTSVGVLAPCYGASHVIYGLETPNFRHEKLPALTLSKLDRSGTFFSFTPLILDINTPLVHTWNSIPLNKDFVVSFELEIPRYLGVFHDRQIAFALRMLQSSRCKAILPLSEFARNWALARFKQFGQDNLKEKLQVFRGAVRDPMVQLVGSYREFDILANPLKAVLIGTQLFHKGVIFAIQAFKRLRAAGRNVELTIIGEFEGWSHGYRDQTPSSSHWQDVAETENWITLRGPVSRDEVFNELRRHHICLAPSLDESLGWLTIEAQLCETPVIANRVCAHPELVQHGKSGWLVDLPLSPDGRWEGMHARGDEHRIKLEQATEVITESIVSAIETVYNDSTLLEKWGRTGRANMLELYGIERASRELETIYTGSLNTYR